MRIHVEECRLLPGCAGGLTERTALVDLAVDDPPAHTPELDARVHAAATAFCPDQHFYDITDSDWPAGFLSPVAPAEGPTRWLGQWVVALTVAAQRWGHDPAFRGRVVGAEPDRLRLAIPWARERPFVDALQMATQLVAQWVRVRPDRAAVRRIDRDFRARLDAVQAGGLNSDSLRFAECAARTGIPYELAPGTVRYGWGANAEYLDGTVTGDTGVLAAALARNKPSANRRLAASGVPVPRCRVATSIAQARAAAAELGWPVVVKPPNQDAGLGVEPGIIDNARLEWAADAAARLGGGRVVVEEHVEGLCYRLLVVHGEMIAAVRRVPAGVLGDGEQSVAALVEQANTDPRRGRMLYRMVVDGAVLEYLKDQGLRLDSVPAAGRRVWLRRTAYTETGGHHEDVTTAVHPDNRALALRVARLIGLDMAGIDLLSTDITRSWREVGGAVCEVNAQPSLMPHWVADPGRDINGEVFAMVFAGRPPRIPTAALTGSGPVTGAAVLLHRIWTAAGVPAGLCTREQVLLDGEVFPAAAFPGLAGVQAVLAEPTARAAVFEVSAATVAEAGHGCDRYDVAAVLGDDRCVEIVERAGSLVTDDPAFAGTSRAILLGGPAGVDAAVVAAHRAGGGTAVVVAGRGGRDWIVAAEGDRETDLAAVDDVHGHLGAAMAAAGLAWAHGLDAAVIAAGLRSKD